MTSPTRIERTLRTKTGRYPVDHRAGPLPAGRVPRIARLLALAHKFDILLRQKVVANGTVLAHLGHVSRARISQIMNLLHLAPDIQEEILFLPLTQRGRDPLRLCQLQGITQIMDWVVQRALWKQLRRAAYSRQKLIAGKGKMVATTGKDRDDQV